MIMDKTNLLIGGAIAVGLYFAFGDRIKSVFGADAGVNTNGDLLVGGNRVYQIPINSGFGSYIGQTAYPLGGAENNLSSLIDGASWMNAAAYTNASFGQNYSGRGIGNE